MKLEILNPHGFCAGVKSALEKARRLAISGERIYCLHEIVHNETVVAELKNRGFVFVEDLSEVPSGDTVLFSAHGVSPAVRREAEARGLKIEDATCPFVARVHRAAADFHAGGLQVVIVGKPSHAEVKGILGEAPDAIVISSPADAERLTFPGSGFRKVGVVSQTTMNADDVAETVAALKKRFKVESMAEVCNATKERQDAVKAFDGEAILVLGSSNSSNTRRLCDVARCRSFRAGNIGELKALDLGGIGRLGVTGGASTPESFFGTALEFLKLKYDTIPL